MVYISSRSRSGSRRSRSRSGSRSRRKDSIFSQVKSRLKKDVVNYSYKKSRAGIVKTKNKTSSAIGFGAKKSYSGIKKTGGFFKMGGSRLYSSVKSKYQNRPSRIESSYNSSSKPLPVVSKKSAYSDNVKLIAS